MLGEFKKFCEEEGVKRWQWVILHNKIEYSRGKSNSDRNDQIYIVWEGSSRKFLGWNDK
jgi:hypothetical protein